MSKQARTKVKTADELLADYLALWRKIGELCDNRIVGCELSREFERLQENLLSDNTVGYNGETVTYTENFYDDHKQIGGFVLKFIANVPDLSAEANEAFKKVMGFPA